MIWALVIFPALCLGLCLPMAFRGEERHPVAGCVWRGLGTGCALAMAVTAAVLGKSGAEYPILALIFFTAGDALLSSIPMLGMGFSLAGLFMDIVWFLRLSPLNILHLQVLTVLVGVTALLLWQWHRALGKMTLPFAVYGAVLCFMGACGTGCFYMGTAGVLCCLGALTLVLGSMMTARSAADGTSRVFRMASRAVCCAAQLLLGAACLCL